MREQICAYYTWKNIRGIYVGNRPKMTILRFFAHLIRTDTQKYATIYVGNYAYIMRGKICVGYTWAIVPKWPFLHVIPMQLRGNSHELPMHIRRGTWELPTYIMRGICVGKMFCANWVPPPFESSTEVGLGNQLPSFWN